MFNLFKFNAPWRLCSKMVFHNENISASRPFTVCVEGNIGSGKTTFLEHFQKLSNTLVLAEPVDKWRDVCGTNLLDKFYHEPTEYAFKFQAYVQLTRLQLHTLKTDLPFKVIERSIFSTRCFIKNMRNQGMITDLETKLLMDWYDWGVSSAGVSTDLIVYLRTSPEIVYERMIQRARDEENTVPLEYLKSMHEIYEEWLYERNSFSVPAPVLIINGDQTLDEMLEEFNKCKKLIYDRQIEN